MTPESVAAFFHSVADAIPWWLLLIGASVGHGYMLIIGLNVFYAWPMPRSLLKYTRKMDVALAAAGPLFFALALDVIGSRRLYWRLDHWMGFLSGYTMICWFVGAGVAPIFEIFYLLRRP